MSFVSSVDFLFLTTENTNFHKKIDLNIFLRSFVSSVVFIFNIGFHGFNGFFVFVFVFVFVLVVIRWQ